MIFEAEGMKTNLRHLKEMEGKDYIRNIIHYGFKKCKPFARRVITAKMQALVLGLDNFFLINVLVKEIIG